MENNDLHVHQFEEIVVPPTCQESGYTLYQCACGYSRKGNFKPVGDHAFQTVETVPATCAAPGNVKLVCTACGQQRVEEVPPQGHNYGPWVVQDYPTCTETGKQVCRCNSCAAVKENVIKPTGHKPAPGTERKEKGVLNFFCENCGQTVSCACETLQESGRKKLYIPTRIVLALTALCAFLRLVLSLAASQATTGVRIAVNPMAYVLMLTQIVSSVLLIIMAGKVKEKERHTKWMGIVTAIYTAIHTFFFIYDIINWSVLDVDSVTYAVNFVTNVLNNLFPVAVFLLLSVLFFTTAKKKLWHFIFLLVYVAGMEGLMSVLSLIGTTMNLKIYSVFLFYINLCANIGSMLLWVSLVMLLQPVKKAKQKRQIDP